jgi:hypothetical protein
MTKSGEHYERKSNMFKKYLQKMKGGGDSPARKPFCKMVWSWLGHLSEYT